MLGSGSILYPVPWQPYKKPSYGLGMSLLTCAAGQSHPNPAKGAQGLWGWSTGCAKGKLEPGSASQERLGEGGRRGVPSCCFQPPKGGFQGRQSQAACSKTIRGQRHELPQEKSQAAPSIPGCPLGTAGQQARPQVPTLKGCPASMVAPSGAQDAARMGWAETASWAALETSFSGCPSF